MYFGKIVITQRYNYRTLCYVSCIIITILILNSRVYKSDSLLIHGRLGKFTDKIDLSEAMADFTFK